MCSKLATTLLCFASLIALLESLVMFTKVTAPFLNLFPRLSSKYSSNMIPNARSFSLLSSNGKGFGSSEPRLPSIDELAKQNQLRKLVTDYQSGNQNKRVFNDAIKFPSEFLIKVVGMNDSGLLPDVLSIASQYCNQPSESIKHSLKVTAAGNYLSISISPYFTSADQIYAVYEALGKDKRVKLVL